MRCPLFAFLLFSACGAVRPLEPDYVELGGSYGSGEFNRFGLEAEYTEITLTFGYVLQPMAYPPRLRYTGENETSLGVHVPLAGSSVDAMGRPVRPGDPGVPALQEETRGDSEGSSEAKGSAHGAPWWGSPGFLAALAGLVGVVGGIFHKEVRGGAVKATETVFKKRKKK